MKSQLSCLMQSNSGACSIMAWTTTPWTLPSNLGLTVGGRITYVLVQTFNPYTHLPVNVILAKDLLGKYFKPEAKTLVLKNIKKAIRYCPGEYLPSLRVHSWKVANMNNCCLSKLTICSLSALNPYCKTFQDCCWGFCYHGRWYRYRAHGSGFWCR